MLYPLWDTCPVWNASFALHASLTANPLFMVGRFVAWTRELSGCYRPLYYMNTSSEGTENEKVTSLRPVTLMVSQNAFASSKRNYDAGKIWLVHIIDGHDMMNSNQIKQYIRPHLSIFRHLVVYAMCFNKYSDIVHPSDAGPSSGSLYRCIPV